MLSDKGVQNLADQIHTMWVMPEINKRKAAGTITDDFRVRRCLIKLPQDADPIVEFNDEIEWTALAKKPLGIAMKAGDPVFLSQIELFETVEPPEVNGKRVSFVFVHFNGIEWRIIFDSTPNLSSDEVASFSPGNWDLGRTIAKCINDDLRDRAVVYHDEVASGIESIGLWAASAILPYPLSAIAEQVEIGNTIAARKLLVDHCTTNFIRNLVVSWVSVPAFTDRQQLFDEALTAHEERRYTLSISAIVPQIEGLITDWIYSKLPKSAVPFPQKQKTQKFQEILSAGARRRYSDQRIAESVVAFILNGPVMSTFNDWLAPVPNSFPNRHTVGHGRFALDVYSEENSIKVFLMLDTLFQIMSQHVDVIGP